NGRPAHVGSLAARSTVAAGQDADAQRSLRCALSVRRPVVVARLAFALVARGRRGGLLAVRGVSGVLFVLPVLVPAVCHRLALPPPRLYARPGRRCRAMWSRRRGVPSWRAVVRSFLRPLVPSGHWRGCRDGTALADESMVLI